MTLQENLTTIGAFTKTMIVSNTLALMPLLRRLVMLIARFVVIMLIVFLLIFADMIAGILVISKII
jgi:hypothetical protein